MAMLEQENLTTGEMASAITAAFVYIVKQRGGSLHFSVDDLKFSGAVYVKIR